MPLAPRSCFSAACIDTLARGGTVVTSTARAARALRTEYGAIERSRGLDSWVSPRIFDWDQWLVELWRRRLQSGQETRLVLSPEQELRIWGRLIAPSIEGRRLTSTAGIADLALSAYSLLARYNAGKLPSPTSFETLDITSFSRWAAAFAGECHAHGWISRSSLEHELSTLGHELMGAEPDFFPRQILLIGFDSMTPAAEELIACCRRSGSDINQIDPIDPSSANAIRALVRASDPREEIELCADWAAQILESSSEQSRIRIGVIVPDQAARREDLDRIFRRRLAGATSPLASDQKLPFEFSLGAALRQMPIVRAALLLLRWMDQELPQEEITWLLLSGFLWEEDFDLLFFARLDADKRRNALLPPEQKLDGYLKGSCWERFAATSKLQARLRRARAAFRSDAARELRFDQWADRAAKILERAGFPGSRKFSSEEHQVESRWTRLLGQAATLSFDGSREPYGEFLNTLDRAAGMAIFSPESAGAPIQILGPLEAAGMEFDYLWFLGADDVGWPAAGEPHPFLPRDLQKARAMPHADSHADWELARLVTARLRASSGQMIVSYPAQAEDGPRRRSTIFPLQGHSEPDGLKDVEPGELRCLLGLPETAGSPPVCLEEADEPALGPAWPVDQPAPGGSYLLRSQAACPFQAFARYRLRANSVDAIGWGLNPAQRGLLLHDALAAFWKDMKSSEALHAARRDGNLDGQIEACCSMAFAKWRKATTDRWLLAYLDAEQARLAVLISRWLDVELARTSFQVDAVEKREDGEIGGLKLRMRVDRIDKIAGGKLIIDYKTGAGKTLDWEDPRPDEPQLPLYAASSAIEDLVGVTLARIQAGNFGFDNLCVGEPDPASLVGKKANGPPYSSSLRRQWQSILATLAQQFADGVASIDPKRYPLTCKYCEFQSLCRIAEQDRENLNDHSDEASGAGEDD